MQKDSDPSITLEIPLIFKIRMVNYGLGQGVVTVRVLVFSFYIAFCYGAGWGVWPEIGKWFCGLTIHLMRRVIIGLYFGFDLSVFLEWKWKHLLRKLSPAKIEQLIQILSTLGEDNR